MGQGRLRLTTTIIGVGLILLGVALFFATSAGGIDAIVPTWALPTIAGSMVVVGVLAVCLAASPTSRTRDPMRRVQRIDTDLPPDDALAQVADLVAQHGGTSTRLTETHLDASLGSQLALRLMGITTQFGTDRLPYRLDVESLHAAGRTRLELTFRSDEGWYIIRGRIKDLEQAYDRRFTYFTEVLRSKIDGNG